MIRRLLNRLAFGLTSLACVYVLTFVMVVSLPGNPLQQGERNIDPQIEQALRARYDLDSNWRYFWQFLSGACRFDFGPTFQYQDWTCNQIIAQSLPVSVLLGLSAVVVALLIGVPTGVLAASKGGRWFETAGVAVALLGISIPTFVVGVGLMLVFSVYLGWTPIGGWGTLAHLPLPVLTLSLPIAAYITRLMRAGMRDALDRDFIRTALAKGVSRRRTVWKHAFPVAFLPVLGYLGPATAQAMTGSFVVEKVFNIPGIGQHFVSAALNRDPGLLMSTVLVYAALLILLNIGVDVLYAFLDPRIRRSVG